MSTPPLPEGPLAQAVVDTLRESLLVLDAKFTVLVANASFYRTFRARPESTLGRPLGRLGEGQWEIPALRARLAESLTREQPFDDFEVEHDFSGLGRRVMRLNGRRLTGGGGERILLAIEDVTARVDAERKLEAVSAELRRSNAELEQFASVASHDLQEPLRMVVSYLQLLEDEHKASLPAEAREYMDFASGGARRMQQLIADLLAYAQIDKGDHPASDCPLDAALNRALEALGPALEESGGRVERAPLPSVKGHAWQLAQLFQNLLGNALKFRAEGRAPFVRVSASRDGALWRVVVADNGPGIPAQDQDRIFAPFERLHGAEVPGTGIGLALCRRIVERHGGRIWVESSSGDGSRLAFTLPATGEQP